MLLAAWVCGSSGKTSWRKQISLLELVSSRPSLEGFVTGGQACFIAELLLRYGCFFSNVREQHDLEGDWLMASHLSPTALSLQSKAFLVCLKLKVCLGVCVFVFLVDVMRKEYLRKKTHPFFKAW